MSPDVFSAARNTCEAVFDGSYVPARGQPTRDVRAARQTVRMISKCVFELAAVLAVVVTLAPVAGYAAQAQQEKIVREKPSEPRKLDRSGRKQVGKASFYARKFAGRKMADGTPMKPHGDNAASKTLPLGTTARVTNQETGQSAVVTIRDRGPYVPGRIIDLSPATAEDIGLTREEGVAPVVVAPIEVPMADGSVKAGEGAK